MSLWVSVLVLATLVACRLTHLVVADLLFLPLRNWAASRPARRMLWELLRCPWCIGFWISLGCVALAWLVAPHPHLAGWFMIPAEAFAVSYVVGWLAGWEDQE